MNPQACCVTHTCTGIIQSPPAETPPADRDCGQAALQGGSPGGAAEGCINTEHASQPQLLLYLLHMPHGSSGGDKTMIRRRTASAAMQQQLPWLEVRQGLLRAGPFRHEGGSQGTLSLDRGLVLEPQLSLCEHCWGRSKHIKHHP